MVGALHSAFGSHHARAVHAKGTILQGSFTPSPQARELSHAALFASGTIPVTARFSDFTGLPDIPDTAGEANPRGFAIKFRVPGDADVDLVMHSFNGFPTRTSDEFAQLLRAIGASGADAVKPTELDRFLDAHPVAKTFLTTQKPAPVSYATLTYFGVNAFTFTDAQQQRHLVRYRFVPKAGEQLLDAAALRTKGPDYLQQEIAARVGRSTDRLRLVCADRRGRRCRRRPIARLAREPAAGSARQRHDHRARRGTDHRQGLAVPAGPVAPGHRGVRPDDRDAQRGLPDLVRRAAMTRAYCALAKAGAQERTAPRCPTAMHRPHAFPARTRSAGVGSPCSLPPRRSPRRGCSARTIRRARSA